MKQLSKFLALIFNDGGRVVSEKRNRLLLILLSIHIVILMDKDCLKINTSIPILILILQCKEWIIVQQN